MVLVSEDCGYSVDSVAGHISLERYSYQPSLPCRVPDLYDAPRNQEGLIPSILTLSQQVINKLIVFYPSLSVKIVGDFCSLFKD